MPSRLGRTGGVGEEVASFGRAIRVLTGEASITGRAGALDAFDGECSSVSPGDFLNF